MKQNPVSVQFPKGTPFRERWRVLIAVLRFKAEYDRATPEGQERMIRFLEQQPGVTVRPTGK